MSEIDSDNPLAEELELDNEDLPGSTEETQENTEVQAKTEATQEDPTEESETTEEQTEKPKKKSGIQRRIAREQRKTEEVRAEFEAYKAQHQPTQSTESQEPNPEDYDKGESDPLFIRELASFEGKKAFYEAKAQDEQTTRQNKMNETIQAASVNYSDKLETAMDKHDDFEDLLETSDVQFNDPNVQHAIMTSEQAGELAYYLAKNPKEASKISQMEPISAIRELGRIEGSLTTKTPVARKQSKMTSPLDTVGSRAKGSKPEYDDDGDQGNFDETFPNLPDY